MAGEDLRQMRKGFVLLILLSGCAAPGPEQPAEPEAPPAVSTAPASENVAVASLMDTARADAAANRLGSAAASLERALRIEPRNPRLWHELALVRLRQGDYAQAVSTAQRSNTWAGADAELRAANQRIIDEAKAR
jgi:Flp pilus assembly protein TadD